MSASNQETNATSRLDNFYADEDHASTPKEYFKEAVKLLQAETSSSAFSQFIDVGCACGDFLKYASRYIKADQYVGFDKFEEMVDEASSRLPDFSFFTSDLNQKASTYSSPLPASSSPGIATMLGVLSIFSTKDWISNFSSLIPNSGIGLIFGMVNPYPYDVLIRLVNQSGENEYGWNSWSLETLRKEFLSLGFSLKHIPWSTPIKIEHNSDNPLRSWTIEKADGTNITVNGSRMIHDYAFLIIKPL